MNKTLIFIIIVTILAMSLAIANTESIQSTLHDIKTTIQGESNKEPIDNITDNSNKNNIKTYDKNGIYFQYPSYWTYDHLNKFFSLYQKEYLSRWDDGMIFYLENKPIEEVLKLQQELERYKNPQSITVDGKRAYSLTATKGDYWHYLILVEKNKNETYIFIFYTDRELKKQNKVLFDEIISTMRLY
jgi:hypothetical protein